MMLIIIMIIFFMLLHTLAVVDLDSLLIVLKEELTLTLAWLWEFPRG